MSCNSVRTRASLSGLHWLSAAPVLVLVELQHQADSLCYFPCTPYTHESLLPCPIGTPSRTLSWSPSVASCPHLQLHSASALLVLNISEMGVFMGLTPSTDWASIDLQDQTAPYVPEPLGLGLLQPRVWRLFFPGFPACEHGGMDGGFYERRHCICKLRVHSFQITAALFAHSISYMFQKMPKKKKKEASIKLLFRICVNPPSRTVYVQSSSSCFSGGGGTFRNHAAPCCSEVQTSVQFSCFAN